MKENMKIILASASPRRRELLGQIGLDFQVLVSEVEEKVTTDVPYLVVEQLSAKKAKAVAKKLETEEPVVVIGADTIVACDGQILGKPKDKQEAVHMLQKLQGRSHQVYTGVTLIYQGEVRTFHEATEVEFYPMTDAEITAYVETSDPLDKAGAYGIQGFCARYIKGIVGDYNNVVGLPVGRLYQEIKRLRNGDYLYEKGSNF